MLMEKKKNKFLGFIVFYMTWIVGDRRRGSKGDLSQVVVKSFPLASDIAFGKFKEFFSLYVNRVSE